MSQTPCKTIYTDHDVIAIVIISSSSSNNSHNIVMDRNISTYSFNVDLCAKQEYVLWNADHCCASGYVTFTQGFSLWALLGAYYAEKVAEYAKIQN